MPFSNFLVGKAHTGISEQKACSSTRLNQLFAGASHCHLMCMRLNLNNVTICAADSVNLDWTIRALRLSMEQCEFGDAILFTDAPIEGPFRTITIEKLRSLADYQAFRLRPPSELLAAAYVLFVEWDGYVVEPRAWNQKFYDYDYIGAKWPHYSDGMTVGNSGFSLQSGKLLKVLAEQNFPFDGTSTVDTIICRTHRPALERQYGIRFAPESLAVKFSYENEAPAGPTFGFHGMANMWRYVEDSEMVKLFDSIDPRVFRTPHCLILLCNYHRLRRFEPMSRLYAKIRPAFAPDELLNMLILLRGRADGDDVFGACERHWLATISGRQLKTNASWSRISRNEPCPCGSGKRYKHCHGRG
jgi:hypothetical protein